MVRADEEGGNLVHLSTNLRRLDPCLLGPVFGALAQHVGLNPVEMQKAAAAGGSAGPPDPRYPEVTALIHAARRDWLRWGKQLVTAIEDLYKAGHLYPMSPANEYLLHELFRDHEVKLVARFAGRHADLPRYERLVRQGAVSPGLASASYIDIAFKLGRGLDMLHAHALRTDGAPPLAEIVRQAMRQPLTPQDERALDYATRRAAVYMRRPAESATSAAERVLTEEQGAAIRGAVAKAVEEHEGWKRLKPRLREAVVGHPALQNDLDRVARTELAFAHSFGAYIGLKDQTAKAGLHDPEVYKFVAPRSCKDCKRVWGPPGNPNRYKLSLVEAREAQGGNFQLPRAEWGPVIGPMHPNCTEGPLQFYDATLVDSINKTADELLAHWHGG